MAKTSPIQNLHYPPYNAGSHTIGTPAYRPLDSLFYPIKAPHGGSVLKSLALAGGIGAVAGAGYNLARRAASALGLAKEPERGVLESAGYGAAAGGILSGLGNMFLQPGNNNPKLTFPGDQKFERYTGAIAPGEDPYRHADLGEKGGWGRAKTGALEGTAAGLGIGLLTGVPIGAAIGGARYSMLSEGDKRNESLAKNLLWGMLLGGGINATAKGIQGAYQDYQASKTAAWSPDVVSPRALMAMAMAEPAMSWPEKSMVMAEAEAAAGAGPGGVTVRDAIGGGFGGLAGYMLAKTSGMGRVGTAVLAGIGGLAGHALTKSRPQGPQPGFRIYR